MLPEGDPGNPVFGKMLFEGIEKSLARIEDHRLIRKNLAKCLPYSNWSGGALALNDVKFTSVGSESDDIKLGATEVQFSNRGTAILFGDIPLYYVLVERFGMFAFFLLGHTRVLFWARKQTTLQFSRFDIYTNSYLSLSGEQPPRAGQ